jgi:hypothetical protein
MCVYPFVQKKYWEDKSETEEISYLQGVSDKGMERREKIGTG